LTETAVTEDPSTAFLTPERVRAALAAPMPQVYAGASTVGAFLAAVLSGVWFDGTGFDVGSPLGNGAWRSDIYHALIAAGLTPYSAVSPTTGPADPAAKAEADALITAAIHQICQPQPAPGPLTARMEKVAKALDDSGEAVGAAVSDFIAKAMDLTDLGRAIAAEADELRAGAGAVVLAEALGTPDPAALDGTR
jgi:hypothetical protein